MMPPPKKKIGLPPPKVVIPKRKSIQKQQQQDLLLVESEWENEWQGMPQFISKEIMPFHTIYVHFETLDAIKDFSAKIGIKINTEVKEVKYTPRIWFPKRDNLKIAHLRYKSDK